MIYLGYNKAKGIIKMTNEQQALFLEAEGLETYETIMDVIDDHKELETQGYDVFGIVKDYLKLIK